MSERTGEAGQAGEAGTVAPRRQTEQLWTVQCLRAVAALMVVIAHAQSAVEPISRQSGTGFVRSDFLPWGASVELFFVISGFIMVYASHRLFATRRAGWTFVTRRLVRIVPLYWLATSGYLAILAAASFKGGDPFPSLAEIASSYVFLPYGIDQQHMAFPVFSLGWTLNYEMFFYVLFAFAVALPHRVAAALVAGGIVVLVAVGTLVPPSLVALHFWTRPILLDFAFGLGIGVAAIEGVRMDPRLRLALVVAGGVVMAADLLHVFAVPVGTTVPNEFPRVLSAGLAAAALLAGAVLGPQPPLRAWLRAGPRALARIGDASYSLYLLHPFVIIVLEKAAQKSALVRDLPPVALVLSVIAAAIALALVGYARFEQPAARFLNAQLRARRGSGAMSGTTGLQGAP